MDPFDAGICIVRIWFNSQAVQSYNWTRLRCPELPFTSQYNVLYIEAGINAYIRALWSKQVAYGYFKVFCSLRIIKGIDNKVFIKGT